MERVDRKSYLEGKLIEGLRVLHGLFEGVTGDRDFSLDTVGTTELTPSQGEFYEIVRSRADKAREIVRYLEGRFGLTAQEDTYKDEGLAKAFSMKFDDPEGLYKLVTGRKAPQKVEAFSHNVGVSFMKNRWQYKTAAGHVASRNIMYDQLSVPLEDTIKRLRNGKATNIAELAVVLPSLDICVDRIKSGKWRVNVKTEDELFKAIFGAFNYEHIGERHLRAIYRHEIRHIFDGIIGENVMDGHVEAQTHLYGGDPVGRGVSRDYKYLFDTIQLTEATLQKLISLNAPDCIVENSRKSLDRHQRRKKRIEEEIFPLWQNNAQKIDRLPLESKEILSYLFSTGSREKVASRLSRVVEVLDTS